MAKKRTSANFKSAAAYKKWLAYGHMHVKGFGKTPLKVKIRGKAHRVKHSKKTKRTHKRKR